MALGIQSTGGGHLYHVHAAAGGAKEINVGTTTPHPFPGSQGQVANVPYTYGVAVDRDPLLLHKSLVGSQYPLVLQATRDLLLTLWFMESRHCSLLSFLCHRPLVRACYPI